MSPSHQKELPDAPISLEPLIDSPPETKLVAEMERALRQRITTEPVQVTEYESIDFSDLLPEGGGGETP